MPLCLGKHQRLVYSFIKILITAYVRALENEHRMIFTCVSSVLQHTGSSQGQGTLLVQLVISHCIDQSLSINNS